MDAIYFVTKNYFWTIKKEETSWILNQQAVDQEFVSLAYDQKMNRMYAGSFDHGLWFSQDEGESWERIGEGVLPTRIMSLAISPHNEEGPHQALWVGSEPSALYRSTDGGKHWVEHPSLLKLPSQPSWRFPPRPYTHHVRTIQVDKYEAKRIFVGIELGGVMKSEDKGITWEDRKPGSQFDVHSLTMTDSAPGRLYEAAGGGFAQSKDGGASWQTENEGLEDNTYLVHLAVNQANPDIIVASAAKGPRYAYQPSRAESVLVRKEGNNNWEVIQAGLPEAKGSTVFHLMASARLPNHFYALNNRGLFQSKDSGLTWEQVPLRFPEELTQKRIYACEGVESVR